jgi:hypothetical protein
VNEPHPNPQITVREASDVILARFLLYSPAARVAASALREGAEVGITFTDVPGQWRFRGVANATSLLLEPGQASDPDFELQVTPGALDSICSRPHAEIGELGVAFFEHVCARDPEKKIRINLHSGLVKLTRRGWLGVLSKGGSTTVSWLAGKGLRGAGAVAGALGRFKG